MYRPTRWYNGLDRLFYRLIRSMLTKHTFNMPEYLVRVRQASESNECKKCNRCIDRHAGIMAPTDYFTAQIGPKQLTKHTSGIPEYLVPVKKATESNEYRKVYDRLCIDRYASIKTSTDYFTGQFGPSLRITQ